MSAYRHTDADDDELIVSMETIAIKSRRFPPYTAGDVMLQVTLPTNRAEVRALIEAILEATDCEIDSDGGWLVVST